ARPALFPDARPSTFLGTPPPRADIHSPCATAPGREPPRQKAVTAWAIAGQLTSFGVLGAWVGAHPNRLHDTGVPMARRRRPPLAKQSTPQPDGRTVPHATSGALLTV